MPVHIALILVLLGATAWARAAAPAARAEAVGATHRPEGAWVRFDDRADASSYLDAALDAGRWLRSVQLETEHGVHIPMDPRHPGDVRHLYSGTPGVIIFYIELARATRDDAWLDDARRLADDLAANLADPTSGEGAGLYTGLAGQAFVLNELARALGPHGTPYATHARDAIDRLLRAGRIMNDGGVTWNDSTDVISGTAGIGLTLLYAAREMHHPEALNAAQLAGDALLALAEPVTLDDGADGLRWSMTPEYPRRMPNFSHGTAGVAYFLATLHDTRREIDARRAAAQSGRRGSMLLHQRACPAGEACIYNISADEMGNVRPIGIDVVAPADADRFIDAATAGARYLVSIADTTADGCRIHHHSPDGESLYYLSWCHGPAGTARLFHRLHVMTRDDAWATWRDRAATSVMSSGVPERRPPGLWNNVGICCGTAGAGQFILELDRRTPAPEFRDFMSRISADLLARAETSPDGTSRFWPHAEHRTQPKLIIAQTGYMQGAAGIGCWLLAHRAHLRHERLRVRLPDDPW